MFVFQSDSVFVKQVKPDSLNAKSGPAVDSKEWTAWVKEKVSGIESYLEMAKKMPDKNILKEDRDWGIYQLKEGKGSFLQATQDLVNSIFTSAKHDSVPIKYGTDHLVEMYNLVSDPYFDWKKVVSKGKDTPQGAFTWEELDIAGCLSAIGKMKEGLGINKVELPAFASEENQRKGKGQTGKSNLSKVTPTKQVAVQTKAPATEVSEQTLSSLKKKNPEFAKRIDKIASDYPAEAKEISINKALGMVHKYSFFSAKSLESLSEPELLALAKKVGTEYGYHKRQGEWGSVVRP